MRGVNHMSKDLSTVIHSILTEMDDCICEQENIIIEEREAMHTFDALALTALVERRARSQSKLNELESQCYLLCDQVGHTTDKNNRMAYIIEHFTVSQTDELQDKRINLVRRMQALESDHIENHIRLRAAWNVTTSILQHIGVIETKSTYGNAAHAAHGAR